MPQPPSPVTSPTRRISATPFAVACATRSIPVFGSPPEPHYDSGLPFEFDGDPATVLAQYGPQVLARLNFDRGRILPAVLFNASAGATLHRSDRFTTTFQADAENLNNTLDVLDFGGLFSGNAIGPARSAFLRLSTTF